jgi:hypothetical protein
MQITSTTLPMRGQVFPAYTDGGKIERAAFVLLEAA